VSATVSEQQTLELERCVGAGGVAVFPSDTVYGLCCDPDDAAAAARVYELKGRAPERPAAVMFFDLARMGPAIPELSVLERAALAALLPGPVTVLLGNPARRFPAACGPEPGTVGVRVPVLLGPVAALRGVRAAVMQSSANLSGGADARTLGEVPESIRRGADLVIDGGELAGMPSTVLDLRSFEGEGTWRVLRDGAIGGAAIARLLEGVRPTPA